MGNKVSDKTTWRKLSKEIRETQGVCEVCGKPHKTMNIHHILPWRTYKEFRFERMNLIVLCPGHHKFFKLNAESNSVWFADWLKQNKSIQFNWILQHIGDSNGPTTTN